MKTVNSEAIAAALNIDHTAAFALGVQDGREQGFELSSGMTYDDLDAQWAYDTGTHIGACLAVRHPAEAPACTHTVIGRTSEGIDGSDVYCLVKRTDKEALFVDEAVAYLLPLVYREGNGPGTAYCHTVRGTPSPVAASEVICIVERRFDV